MGYLDFEALVKEADQKMIDQAVNDSAVDGRERGLLVCVLGHGYSGTNRIAEAETCYQWVLDNFPNEVHPEETAAYSLAVMEDRKNVESPKVGAAAYEQFLNTHPSGAYSADALLREGESYLRANDTADAAKSFRRALQEFSEEPDTIAKAEKSLAQLPPGS
jgi:TolA-binding protein